MSLAAPEVHLLIPKLFEPLILWEKDFLFKPEAKYLSQLLAQFDVSSQGRSKGLNASMFASIGITAQELPVAYYRLQAHLKLSKSGGDVFSKNNPSQAEKQIVCADPVHLEVGINDITLTQKVTDLSEGQASEILAALNEHFEQDGFQFFYGAEDQWYLSLNADESLLTTPVDEVLRKNIVNYLPSSKTVNWKMIQNEVQMLLHSLAVNTERENKGMPTINSLWFWGGGRPQQANKTINQVITLSPNRDDSVGNTLAQAANCKSKIITDDSDVETTFSTLTGNNIVILNQLLHPTVNDNIDAYQHALEHLDEMFIKPLVHLWLAGKIGLVVDGCDGRELRPAKITSWAIWKKKSRPLVEIAKDIAQ